MKILLIASFIVVTFTFCGTNVMAQNLINFAAAKNASSASISWKVENDADSTIFSIEKSVDRGKTFQSIAIVQSNGSGAYSFADHNPAVGQNQYRLKFQRIHTITNYSGALILLFPSMTTASNSAKLYPGPINHSINQDVTGDDDNLDMSPVSKQ